VICPAGSFWSEESKSCGTCAENEEYDTELKACVACPAGFTFNPDTHKCVRHDFATGTMDICVDDEAPYFNGEKCVSCRLPNFWNEEEKQCEKCPDDFFYNSTVGKCVGCDEGYKFDLARYTCVKSDIFPSTPECPPSAPFRQADRCIACYLPKYWNSDTATCE
jgi:hypothetical protein